jgi:hypothetical protein
MKAIERMGESFGAKVLFQCLLTAINNETQSAGIGRTPPGPHVANGPVFGASNACSFFFIGCTQIQFLDDEWLPTLSGALYYAR